MLFTLIFGKVPSFAYVLACWPSFVVAVVAALDDDEAPAAVFKLAFLFDVFSHASMMDGECIRRAAVYE